MNDISTAFTILSAMITPAVLILASGSLILTTSQRLSRALERARKIYFQFESLQENDHLHDKEIKKYALLRNQIKTITQRAQLLQYAMSTLQITLCLFVATSAAIGIVVLIGIQYAWIPTTLAMAGITLLFYSTVLLIRETRIALVSVKQEMVYANTICEV